MVSTDLYIGTNDPLIGVFILHGIQEKFYLAAKIFTFFFPDQVGDYYFK